MPVVLFAKLEGKTIAELFVRSVMSMMEFELPIENLERRKTKNIIDEVKNEIEDLSDCCQPASRPTCITGVQSSEDQHHRVRNI